MLEDCPSVERNSRVLHRRVVFSTLTNRTGQGLFYWLLFPVSFVVAGHNLDYFSSPFIFYFVSSFQLSFFPVSFLLFLASWFSFSEGSVFHHRTIHPVPLHQLLWLLIQGFCHPSRVSSALCFAVGSAFLWFIFSVPQSFIKH